MTYSWLEGKQTEKEIGKEAAEWQNTGVVNLRLSSWLSCVADWELVIIKYLLGSDLLKIGQVNEIPLGKTGAAETEGCISHQPLCYFGSVYK